MFSALARSLTVALALASTACILGPEPVVAKNVTEGGYCAAEHGPEPKAAHRPPESSQVPAHAAEARGFSARALHTARAIGAIGEVDRLADAEAHGEPDARIVDLRGQVNDAISLATLDLSSTVAAIQCEEGRAGQIATDLRDAEDDQTRNLTAYSLAITAIAAIGSGVLAISDKQNPTPAAAVGIGGGVAGGAVGVGTLAVKRTTTYMHRHNVLREVWNGGEHPDFPEIVWAYLTRAELSKAGGGSIRDYLVASWKESGRLGPDAQHLSDERVALYFGDGGKYDADGLDDRSDMLSEVREAIGLMSHDLQHLATEAAHR
jgi:hypothetical protein